MWGGGEGTHQSSGTGCIGVVLWLRFLFESCAVPVSRHWELVVWPPAGWSQLPQGAGVRMSVRKASRTRTEVLLEPLMLCSIALEVAGEIHVLQVGCRAHVCWRSWVQPCWTDFVVSFCGPSGWVGQRLQRLPCRNRKYEVMALSEGHVSCCPSRVVGRERAQQGSDVCVNA